jgi:aminopeptidase N
MLPPPSPYLNLEVALSMMLPNEKELVEASGSAADPVAIAQTCQHFRRGIAEMLRGTLFEVYASCRDSQDGESGGEASARRELKNVTLQALIQIPDNAEAVALAVHQYQCPENMTDRMGALVALRDVDGPERREALAAFYENYGQDKVVVTKWLREQASSNLPGTLDTVRGTSHICGPFIIFCSLLCVVSRVSSG